MDGLKAAERHLVRGVAESSGWRAARGRLYRSFQDPRAGDLGLSDRRCRFEFAEFRCGLDIFRLEGLMFDNELHHRSPKLVEIGLY